jgi:hypothetical protein
LEVAGILVGRFQFGETEIELLAVASALYVGNDAFAEHHPLRPPATFEVHKRSSFPQVAFQAG